MILNDIERAVICGTREYRTNAEFIDAIEAKLIEKLCAGVEMPEPFWVPQEDLCGNSVGPDLEYYKPDQLRTAIAAARLKALDEAALICGNLHWTWRMGDTSGPKECEAAIRALKGEA